MLASLYATVRKNFSQEQRNRLKAVQGEIRLRAAPLLRAYYGSFGPAELAEHLRTRIGQDFEVLMVHSSMNSLQPMFSGTALDVINILSDLCGPSRTLAMPAFFLGGSTYNARAYYRQHRVFSEKKTPSEMGIISEIFRRQSGVLRSLHPTHSVCARGPLAEELVSKHHLGTTTWGPDTPFDVMTRVDTIIVGFGTRFFRVLTQVHHVEDMMGEAFPAPEEPADPVPVTLLDRNGKSHPFRFPDRTRANLSRRVERLATMMPTEDLQLWSFNGIPFFAVRAAKVSAALLAAARQGRTIYEY